MEHVTNDEGLKTQVFAFVASQPHFEVLAAAIYSHFAAEHDHMEISAALTDLQADESLYMTDDGTFTVGTSDFLGGDATL